MKKLILIISLLLIALPVQARQLSDVKFEFANENNIEQLCRMDWKPIGCFDAPNRIVIRIDDYIPISIIIQSLWHELGHYFLQDLTEKDYQAEFGSQYSFLYLREMAADEFAAMITDKDYIKKMPAERIKFFAGVIK